MHTFWYLTHNWVSIDPCSTHVCLTWGLTSKPCLVGYYKVIPVPKIHSKIENGNVAKPTMGMVLVKKYSTRKLTSDGHRLVSEGSNLLKSQSPIMVGGWGVGDQLSTFDAESKSAKIPKSHYNEGGGGWGWELQTNL